MLVTGESFRALGGLTGDRRIVDMRIADAQREMRTRYGMFIFPATELLLRAAGARGSLSAENSLRSLGMQAAFVLPLSMPLLLPVSRYRLTWFYPALMILLGAHYLPFVFLYGMRMFWMLGGILVGHGLLIAMYWSRTFSVGAWCTGVILLVFAGIGRAVAQREYRDGASSR